MHLFLALLLSAHAGSLAGVTLPDSSTANGQPVNLNGLGLREKFYLDIYVGALYLTHPTHDAAAAIQADEAKKVVLHFIYSKVTSAQMAEAFNESWAKNPASAGLKAQIDQFMGWLATDYVAGDEMVFEYAPGVGTTVKVKGVTKGTIAGADFMRMLWNVWLGPNPPTADLKKGMIGA